MADKDLFNEEDQMTRMTFGEHLEDLRRRLILSLFGLIPGVIIGLCLGGYIVDAMKRPVVDALKDFYKKQDVKRIQRLEEARRLGLPIERKPLVLQLKLDDLREAVRRAVPELNVATESKTATPPEGGNGLNGLEANSDSADEARLIELAVKVPREEMESAIGVDLLARMRLMTLGPMESFMAYMKVSIVAGLVLSSWWVIIQLWQFVAEGLYRTERRIVRRATPISVGLFLVGVMFCFVVVLPVVLRFCFGFNEWFDIDPNIRLSEWLSFATILPVIFGVCFELPLVMLVLESVGIFTIDDYISRWRHAILIIAIVAMVVTPTTDPGSMMLLMVPMVGLYFAGIGVVQMRRGGLRALSPIARLRAAVGTLVTLYLIAVSIGFGIPKDWLSHDWWRNEVWKPGTFPTSWILSSWLPESPSQNWLWGVTLLNAGVFGLVILRLGELVLRFVGRRSTSVANEPKPEKGHDAGEQP